MNHDTIQRRPYDDKGRYVPMQCELCGSGSLQFQGRGFWSCDGLLDPGHPDIELQACPAFHYDGQPAVPVSELQP